MRNSKKGKQQRHGERQDLHFSLSLFHCTFVLFKNTIIKSVFHVNDFFSIFLLNLVNMSSFFTMGLGKKSKCIYIDKGKDEGKIIKGVKLKDK